MLEREKVSSEETQAASEQIILKPTIILWASSTIPQSLFLNIYPTSPSDAPIRSRFWLET